jgi:hypothetical protein
MCHEVVSISALTEAQKTTLVSSGEDIETTLVSSVKDIKTTLVTSGKDIKTTLVPSGKDIKTTLVSSGELHMLLAEIISLVSGSIYVKVLQPLPRGLRVVDLKPFHPHADRISPRIR